MEMCKFYHGTTSEKWHKILNEGFLWGYNTYKNDDGTTYNSYRYTYLTPNKEVAMKYGDVLLEIEYDPVGVNDKGIDNYGFEPPKGQTCWQFSVFVPINISKIKIINE